MKVTSEKRRPSTVKNYVSNVSYFKVKVNEKIIISKSDEITVHQL